MTLQELRQAVTEATTPTEELITAVLDFADDLDPYGFRDYYGIPGTPEFNMTEAREDAIYMLTEARQELLEQIDFAIQEA